ncbi:MAG: hypothetical protein U9P73_02280 [Candidatus Cloacimonadota bacterium]|nr:hypothetical protein [Candidatus Cloacimonadota bacterium]
MKYKQLTNLQGFRVLEHFENLEGFRVLERFGNLQGSRCFGNLEGLV